MPIIDLSQKWEIISSILMKYVVFDNDHLELFHIESCIHLNSAFINQINDGTLLLWLWWLDTLF